MRTKFVQNNQIWIPRTPIDGNGANYGGNFQFASMRNAFHATCFWFFGNVAADATIAIQQAKNIGGNGAKLYTIDQIYKLPTAAGTARDQTQPLVETVNGTSYTVSNTTQDNFAFFVEIEAEQLDVNNGYDCIRPTFAGGAGATLVTMGVIFSNLKFKGDLADPRTMPSPLLGENEQY